MILEAFNRNWSKKFRSLTEIDSIQIHLRRQADFKGFNILTNCQNISKKGIEDRINKEIENP